MNFIKLHKNKILKGLLLLFLVAMLVFPSAAFNGARTGLLLWFHNVLPNLLPFIIVSNLMIRLNITKQISKVFHPLLGRLFHISNEGCYPIVIGFLSGIPMGAKSSSDLLSDNRIGPKEGQFLCNLCNNASPMFIIGYIALSQLQLPKIKYALFLIIYGSAILGAFIVRFFYDRLTKKDLHNLPEIRIVKKQVNKLPSRFSFDLLDGSIMNGFEIVTRIGGYIILFSILAQIIREIGPNTGFFKAFIMGICEITTGINQVCNTTADINVKIVLTAVLTSFGGLSGIAQTKSVLQDSRLSIKYYFIAKLISAIIALLLAVLYVTFFRVI
jgi:sporulation integral membrane protein YlbJ